MQTCPRQGLHTWMTTAWISMMASFAGVRRSIHRWSRRVSWFTVANWAPSLCSSSSERMASASSKGRLPARDVQWMLCTFSSTCSRGKFTYFDMRGTSCVLGSVSMIQVTHQLACMQHSPGCQRRVSSDKAKLQHLV